MSDTLKVSLGSLTKYENLVKNSKTETGTLYFAKDSNNRAYIYLNGYNIIPKFLDLRNGGLGTDFTNSSVKSYAIYMRGPGSYDSDYVNPAQGAFYTTTANDIVQKPQFGTLPVIVGGTGKTSFTSGALVYGNGTGALNTLSAGTKSYILVSTGSAPKYVKPEMKWTAGTTSGPKFSFMINGQEFTADTYIIPSASTTASGIVTNANQSFAGQKTFTGTTYTVDIEPSKDNSYSLGTDKKAWNTVRSHYLELYDGGNQLIISTGYDGGTTTKTGVSYIAIGNNLTSTTNKNSQGILRLYSSSSGYVDISANPSTKAYTYMFPAAYGVDSALIAVADKSPIGNTTDTTFYIPFYRHTSNSLPTPNGHLTHSEGYKIITADGVASATVPGHTTLVLGNSSASGAAANSHGVLRLYGTNTGYTALKANGSNGTSNLEIVLPAASGELIYHVEESEQGGSGQLVKVSKVGKIENDTTSATSDLKLLYLKAGKLTESAQTKGSGKKLIYLSSGTITESSSTVGSGIKLMYLNAGTLTESSSSVANGKKQLMYLDAGELKASDADVASATKLMYLLDGVLTASSSTIAGSTQLMYMNAGTMTASTTSVGSKTAPVYLNAGVITQCDELLSAFSGSDSASDNQMSITVGDTTKTATIIGGVSNSWANGTTSGPTITTTVNGKAGSAKAIPSASYSYSGVVTTGAQTFKGVKSFANGITISNGNSTTDCATLTYDGDTLTISFG